ncbi:MAG: LuxR C-terminal-related transcriptional regulator, partial [Bacteroidales bacterium]|nr:LuxR C-terminal-related transcriptional regulator [Bacteroidales bacterium]
EKEKLKRAEDRNQFNEMQKAIVDMEIKVIQNENANLHKRLEIKRKDLINNALWIGQQRDFLEDLYSDIHELRALDDITNIKEGIFSIEKKIMDKKAFSHEMNELYSQVEVLHKDYSVILHERFPDLTEQEKRLATLLRLGFSTKELASIMSITPKSVEVCRYRLRKKLNLKRDENLIQFIKSL